MVPERGPPGGCKAGQGERGSAKKGVMNDQGNLRVEISKRAGAEEAVWSMNRREFIKTAAAAGAVLGSGARGRGAEATPEKRGDMPYRPLGGTGEKVSALGLGGAHIGKPD